VVGAGEAFGSAMVLALLHLRPGLVQWHVICRTG
jgi:hypothetical protein